MRFSVCRIFPSLKNLKLLAIGMWLNRIKNIFRLTDFVPFCPYTIDADYYKDARKNFSLEEWIEILLGAIDYNSSGFQTQSQKMSVLMRRLPFVEKRLNLIELAPKETGKSYVFSKTHDT